MFSKRFLFYFVLKHYLPRSIDEVDNQRRYGKNEDKANLKIIKNPEEMINTSTVSGAWQNQMFEGPIRLNFHGQINLI